MANYTPFDDIILKMYRTLEIAKLGEPILKEKAKAVEDIKDEKIQQLIDAMIVRMAEPFDNGIMGAGLCAPQVFQSLRLFVMTPLHKDISKELTVVINPEIISHGKEKEKKAEGCLSIPDFTGLVSRYNEVKVKFQDRNGNTVEDTITGFTARVFQHEYDHLEGILFLDRITSPKDLFRDSDKQQ